MSWSTIPTFDDPYVQTHESTHKASGARLVEVLYGSVNEQGEPQPPARGDGHGHLIVIELKGSFEPLIERAPLGPGTEAEMRQRAATLSDLDRRDWDRAYKSKLLHDLEHDLIQRRRLCSRMEGLSRGKMSSLRQVFDEIHTEWDGLRRWEVPVEDELASRFNQADELCRSALEKQQEHAVAKETLIAEAKTLSESTNWGPTNAAFDELFGRWRAVGSAGRKEDQRLWEAFNSYRHAYYQHRDEHFKELRARQAKSREEKEAILEEARAAFLDVQDWREAGERMDSFMDRWKAAGSAGREQEERLWGEFKALRNDFSAARRAFYAELHVKREAVAEKKRQLVAEATAIAQLEDYSNEQTDRMKQLSVEWKEAGSAGHEVDRSLWSEFRAAQDGFWDARRLEMRELHAERSGRMQSAIDRRQDQIENLYDQVEALRERLLRTASIEKQTEINAWITEKGEIIARIEAEIEDMRKRM